MEWEAMPVRQAAYICSLLENPSKRWVGNMTDSRSCNGYRHASGAGIGGAHHASGAGAGGADAHRAGGAGVSGAGGTGASKHDRLKVLPW